MCTDQIYKVDNAIIMAAGMSTRLAPLSIEKPKALLNVKGEVLIERQICQLREAGIEEIVVVVGYLKEQFEYLRERYQVKLIENPYFETRNNHSTLYAAREYLKNSYICSGDNYFVENVFHPYEEKACYSTTYEEGDTDEWCVYTDGNGRILNVEVGGSGQWVMRGHVFFTEEFSHKLIPYLEEAMQSEKEKDVFWENIYIDHIACLELYQKKCSKENILEFDSLKELREFDPRYRNNTGSSVMRQIAAALSCEEQDIADIRPLKKGNSMVGILFHCRYEAYRYFYNTKLIEKIEAV